MTTLPLRPYQTDALDALHEFWRGGGVRGAVVLPTGMGKTVVFAHLIAGAASSGRRRLVLVHREELAQQAADKLRAVLPDAATVGIVKAERNDTDADVIVGSVPTLARAARREQIDPASIGLIVVDEAHHAAAPSWMGVLRYFGAFASIPTAGFTATLTREDGRGLGDVWESVVYERDILYGIANGYLADVAGRSITVDGLDLAAVARSRGDYQDGALGEAMQAAGAGAVIARAYAEHAGDRRGVLFAPTVDTAYDFAADLNARDIPTDVITGTTSREDRALAYKRFAAGDVRVLSNCMVLTEGWDAPHAEVAVIARPTQSAGLFQQMVGRVLRPFPGKAGALVLDVVGATGRHALRSLTDLAPGDAEVRDGESLAEAVGRREAELREARGTTFRSRATALMPCDTREVDLFAASHSVWLRTTGGTWFIPTKLWTYFLRPDTPGEDGGERWRIGRKPTYAAPRNAAGGWLRGGLPLDFAMAVGEAQAAEADAHAGLNVSGKSAAWRRKKPSESTVALAARYRIDTTGMRQGEVSDAISVAVASRDLAPFEGVQT